MDSGAMPARYAAVHDDDPAAAQDWVARYEYLFPVEARPDPDHRVAFANYFWTYITTSFEVVIQPGTRGQDAAHGCSCELCARLVSASHLRPRKLRTGDKRRAKQLMTERVKDMAAEHGFDPDEDLLGDLIRDDDTRRMAAYSAYGSWMLLRMEGATDGPSILALWREVAWKRSGSPIQGFELRVTDFLEAERELLFCLADSRIRGMT